MKIQSIKKISKKNWDTYMAGLTAFLKSEHSCEGSIVVAISTFQIWMRLVIPDEILRNTGNFGRALYIIDCERSVLRTSVIF